MSCLKFSWSPFSLIDVDGITWSKPIIHCNEKTGLLWVYVPLLFSSPVTWSSRGQFRARAGGSLNNDSADDLRKLVNKMREKFERANPTTREFTKQLKKCYKLFKILQQLRKLQKQGKTILCLPKDTQEEFIRVMKNKVYWQDCCVLLMSTVKILQANTSPFCLTSLTANLRPFDVIPLWESKDFIDETEQKHEADALQRSLEHQYMQMVTAQSAAPNAFGDTEMANWQMQITESVKFILQTKIQREIEM